MQLADRIQCMVPLNKILDFSTSKCRAKKELRSFISVKPPARIMSTIYRGANFRAESDLMSSSRAEFRNFDAEK